MFFSHNTWKVASARTKLRTADESKAATHLVSRHGELAALMRCSCSHIPKLMFDESRLPVVAGVDEQDGSLASMLVEMSGLSQFPMV